jgi:hypothetical protein
MTWTATPPTAPGWYWCRDAFLGKPGEPKIVYFDGGVFSEDDYAVDLTGWLWWPEPIREPPA